MSIADELGKLDELRARGVISDAEFAEQKKRILTAGTTPEARPASLAANASAPAPRVEVPFVNPKTGERKLIKVGFAWPVGLFGTFLGIPLFLRGLNSWGAICAVLWTINFFVFGVDPDSAVLIEIIEVGMQIWLGFKANEFTAKHLLERGWVFAEPGSEATHHGMMQWKLQPTAS